MAGHDTDRIDLGVGKKLLSHHAHMHTCIHTHEQTDGWTDPEMDGDKRGKKNLENGNLHHPIMHSNDPVNLVHDSRRT